MTLRTDLTEAMKTAMRTKDQPRLDAVRLILAKLKDADIAARPAGQADGIDEGAILALLQTMVKSRRESIELYQKGGRPELAAQEQAEITVIQSFLPAQLDESATHAAVQAAIAATGATSVKDMGKVMAALKASHAGTMDFSAAGAVVKDLLA